MKMNDINKKKIDKNKVDNQESQPTKKYPVGCLRGVILFPVGLLLSILIGIASGQSFGILRGIIIVIVIFIICNAIILFIINKSKTLTIVDCVLPFIISIIAAFIFAPTALFAGNLLSIGTCIFSGVLLSLGLILYKLDKINGAFLILPMLTFIYEILPIDLPSDLDNIIALGVNTLDLVTGGITSQMKRIEK
jgi:hypothetical protein